MLHTCVQRFDLSSTLQKFLGIKQGLRLWFVFLNIITIHTVLHTCYGDAHIKDDACIVVLLELTSILFIYIVKKKSTVLPLVNGSIDFL